MKRGLLVLVAIIFAVGVVVAGCAPEKPVSTAPEEAKPEAPAFEPVTLRVSTIFPPAPAALGSIGLEAFMEEVTKRTDGAVTFDVHWQCSLGGPPEQIDLAKTGTADIVHTHLWYSPDRVPIADFEFVFPFGPMNPAILYKAKKQMYEEFPQFHEELADNNARILMLLGGNHYDFLSKAPITKLADLEGKKVSLIGKYFGRWVAPAGLVPVVAPAHDRYNMLQTEVVDLDLLSVDLYKTFKIYEQAKHLTQCNFCAVCAYEVIMNIDSYNKLSPEVQKIIDEVADETALHYAEVTNPQFEDDVLQFLKDNGVISHPFDKDDLLKWVNECPDTAAEWAEEVEAKGYPGKEIVKRWQEITAEMGYKWPRHWGTK